MGAKSLLLGEYAMGTADSETYFSSEYYNYLKERVEQSPLSSLQENPFFTQKNLIVEQDKN